MDEYISKQDVLKGQKTGTFANGICLVAEPCVTVEYIESLEPADVAPVVRCRNCARLNRNGYCTRFQNNISGIATSWFMPEDDDFCSYGEKRDE